MLTLASLGMVLYGLHSIITGLLDLLGAAGLEWWANLWLMVAGATLLLGAVFVRISMPGGLALAVGGLLALQSISLHNANHLYGQVVLLPQLARALSAGLLIALAYFGWGSEPVNVRAADHSGDPPTPADA